MDHSTKQDRSAVPALNPWVAWILAACVGALVGAAPGLAAQAGAAANNQAFFAGYSRAIYRGLTLGLF